VREEAAVTGCSDPAPPDLRAAVVDLGCGAVLRGTHGVDACPGPCVTWVCRVGFEPLPFADNSVGRFVAYDFLEHLPVSVWQWTPPAPPQVWYPRIDTLREIYRCLIPGGTFFSRTPGRLPEWAQDPTHEAPPWVAETWEYFTGRRAGVAAQYGITWAFELVDCYWDAAWLCVTVRKPA
jgi:SAM-dependent methyltransferase